jgi:hypothetical protein
VWGHAAVPSRGLEFGFFAVSLAAFVGNSVSRRSHLPYSFTDSDADGMDDHWESTHGLMVGVDDASAALDGDGLSDFLEFLFRTDPFNRDTDGDGYADGVEVQLGSNPNDPSSMPNNLARRTDATGVLGTMNALGGTATPVFHAGTAGSINDGDLTTCVDTWNGTGTDSLSYVGIVWANPQNVPIAGLRPDLATFADGGWFGPNTLGPWPGGLLSSNLHLTMPLVQVTRDGGTTWTNVAFTSDYLAALHGHALPAVPYLDPTHATAHFVLTPPQTGVTGVRIVGTEGGAGSGGFLGVGELAVLPRVPVKLLNPRVYRRLGHEDVQFRFQFDSQTNVTHAVQSSATLDSSGWQTETTILGDGTRKTVGLPYSPFYRMLYRVVAQ